MSPTAVFKKRRSRSRSRSRGSKDLKGKFKVPQSPVPQIGGDSSQDENPPLPTPGTLPMVPTLASPIPHFPAFLQQSRFLRSPTPVTPDMSLFYPGTSPSTPLPTLEDLQKGLMRSNSAGSSSAAGRRMAMHKLTGGTETYDPSPSPTPPPFAQKLSRNNTVSGGERSAARLNLLTRLGTRITKEADAEAASGAEDRGARRRPRGPLLGLGLPRQRLVHATTCHDDARLVVVSPPLRLARRRSVGAHERWRWGTCGEVGKDGGEGSVRLRNGVVGSPRPPFRRRRVSWRWGAVAGGGRGH